jgi:hypothetical protein
MPTGIANTGWCDAALNGAVERRRCHGCLRRHHRSEDGRACNLLRHGPVQAHRHARQQRWHLYEQTLHSVHRGRLRGDPGPQCHGFFHITQLAVAEMENQIRGLAVVFGIRLPRALSPAFVRQRSGQARGLPAWPPRCRAWFRRVLPCSPPSRRSTRTSSGWSGHRRLAAA